MTFRDIYSPMNFDPVTIARTQFAEYLRINKVERTISQAHKCIKQIKINANPKNDQQFARANSDKINNGVFDSNGQYCPATYTTNVDDCLYAEVPELTDQTITCLVIPCKNVLRGNTKYQEDIISDEKFNAEYEESRVLLRHKPYALTMVVLLSPRCREKLIEVKEDGRWFDKT